MGVLGFVPLGEIASGNLLYSFGSRGVIADSGTLVYNGWPLLVLLLIIIFLHGFTITKFKNRILQIRLTIINILLMIGFILVSWYFISASLTQIGEGVYSFKLPMAFPIVAAVLDYLAIRSIGSDEALIRSLDRIR
jgi:hypothetical protein